MILDKGPFFLFHFVDEGIWSSYTDDHLSIGIASYKTCRSKITALQYIFIEFKNDKNSAHNLLPICALVFFFSETKLNFKTLFLILAMYCANVSYIIIYTRLKLELVSQLDQHLLQCVSLAIFFFIKCISLTLHKLTLTQNNKIKISIFRNIILGLFTMHWYLTGIGVSLVSGNNKGSIRWLHWETF